MVRAILEDTYNPIFQEELFSFRMRPISKKKLRCRNRYFDCRKFSFSIANISSYPNISLHKNLLDAHFYIFSRWTLDVLEKYEKEISSIKGEFVPFLVKLQLTKVDKKSKIFDDFLCSQKLLEAVPEHVLNVGTLADTMSSSVVSNKDFLGCFAYILEEGYCLRVNTIQTYLEANRDVKNFPAIFFICY